MIVDKKSALKIFYYLMSIDGVSHFEDAKFEEIGTELIGDAFTNIKEQIIGECNSKLNLASSNELEDVIYDEVGKELQNTVEVVAEGIAPRLLVWDMLTLAYCDENYSEKEHSLIVYVAESLDVDRSVFLEMRQLIITAVAVQNELEMLESSDRPYSEIRPLVEQVENRRQVISEAAMALISDDIIKDDPKINEKAVAFVNASKKIGENIIAGTKKVGDAMTPLAKDLGKTAVNGAGAVKSGAGKLFSKVKEAAKKNNIVIPTKFENVKSELADDMGMPKDAIVYAMENGSTHALVVTFQVTEQEAMDFDNPQGVIDTLHEDMSDTAGIIEVKAGVAQNGGRYIYHIMKHRNMTKDGLPLGNAYSLNLNIQIGNTIQFMNCYFDEIGTTGIRDTLVFTMLENEGIVGSDFCGWSKDPYDDEYAKGFLMNMSEDEKYDEMFIDHPLSEIRRLASFVINMN